MIGRHGGIAATATTVGASTWFVPLAVACIAGASLILATILAPIVADRFRSKKPDTTDALLDALERAKTAEDEVTRLKAQLARSRHDKA